MIKVVPGRERPAYSSLKAVDGVLNLYHIFGKFDFFMVGEALGPTQLNRLLDDIRDICDVTEARTILIGWKSGLQSNAVSQACAAMSQACADYSNP
jgi:GTP cyclohydrolase III